MQQLYYEKQSKEKLEIYNAVIFFVQLSLGSKCNFTGEFEAESIFQQHCTSLMYISFVITPRLKDTLMAVRSSWSTLFFCRSAF